jgi:hypothetical protein
MAQYCGYRPRARRPLRAATPGSELPRGDRVTALHRWTRRYPGVAPAEPHQRSRQLRELRAAEEDEQDDEDQQGPHTGLVAAVVLGTLGVGDDEMVRVLRGINRDHGSMLGYALDAGVDLAVVEALRERLLR